jgi:hypothetical protein
VSPRWLTVLSRIAAPRVLLHLPCVWVSRPSLRKDQKCNTLALCDGQVWTCPRALGPSSISPRGPPLDDARDRVDVRLAKRPQPEKHVEEAGLAGRYREQVSETGAILSRPASQSPRHPSLASRHARHYRLEQQHARQGLVPGLGGRSSGVSGSANKVETQSPKLDLALRSVDSQE